MIADINASEALEIVLKKGETSMGQPLHHNFP
jgi:hypothetical protein